MFRRLQIRNSNIPVINTFPVKLCKFRSEKNLRSPYPTPKPTLRACSLEKSRNSNFWAQPHVLSRFPHSDYSLQLHPNKQRVFGAEYINTEKPSSKRTLIYNRSRHSISSSSQSAHHRHSHRENSNGARIALSCGCSINTSCVRMIRYI